MHLRRHGGVARWAYDDEQVCLLVNVQTMERRSRRHYVEPAQGKTNNPLHAVRRKRAQQGKDPAP
jgi:hypothetical protein